MTSTVEGVYRSTEYSIVQNRSILKSWTSRLQERPKINFRKMGTLVLRSIVRWQSEIILYKSYATPPLRVAFLLGRVSPESWKLYESIFFYVVKYLLRKTCFRFYLSTFLSCLILVSIGVWPWEGRKPFLPFPWDPITSRGSGSLRSSHGRGCIDTW